MTNSKATSIRTMLFSLILLLCGQFSLIEAQELRKEGRYYISEITKTFDVRKGGTLLLFDIRGDVEITTWEKSQVLVKEIKRMDVFSREEAETIAERSKSSYRQSGNTIEIGGEYFRRDWIESDFAIKLPKVFMADIETRGGDISVTGLDGEVNARTSGGDLTLREIGGEVEASTSGGDIVVIDSKKQVTVKTSGGDVDLSNIGGPLIAKTSGGDVTLKGSQNRVELNTSGGDIEITDAGGEVSAHTSGGDIEIMNTRGAADVRTSGGDIEFRNIGGTFSASTSGGDIEGTTVAGGARVSTAGGSIELRDVKGGVDAKTAGGDIEVEITLTDFKQPHRVDLRTAGGEITLYIPENLPATVRAEIEISDRWEDYNIYSDFPLKLMSDSEGEGRRRFRKFIRSEGDINGGGDLIEIYTTNGDIYIKKLAR